MIWGQRCPPAGEAKFPRRFPAPRAPPRCGGGWEGPGRLEGGGLGRTGGSGAAPAAAPAAPHRQPERIPGGSGGGPGPRRRLLPPALPPRPAEDGNGGRAGGGRN